MTQKEQFSRAPDPSWFDQFDYTPGQWRAALSDATAQGDVARANSLAELLPFVSPASFAGRFEDTFLVPPHIRLLDEALWRLCSGRSARNKLMVMMPPRHGKSELCSRFTPAWYLARYPERRVILSSYEADFAASWGRKARDIIEGSRDWAGLRIRPDSKAANRWNLVGAKGGMETAGVGGSITGKGAHLLIIDDPVKNAQDARSATTRQTAWDWYVSTAKTRLEPGASQLLIMTRWHEDDLAGRLLLHQRDEWDVICFPALATEEDVLGRSVGEPLWPGAYDLEALEAIRDTPETGYWWSALYQQNPTIEDGGTFARKDFRHYRHRPGLNGGHYDLDGLLVPATQTMRFQTVDLAASRRTRADYTVIATWAITKTEPAHLLLLDRYRGRVETPEHIPLMEEYHHKWSSRRDEPKSRFTLLGRQTYGLAALQEAQRKGMTWMRGEKEDTDKVSRAIQAGQLVKGHLAWFPAGAPWLEEWESELVAFDNGAHDDQVDVFSLAGLEYGKRNSWKPRDRKPEPETIEERAWARARGGRQRRRATHPMLGRW